MPLDLTRITGDLNEMVERIDAAESRARLARLPELFGAVDPEELRSRLDTARTSWLVARPAGDFSGGIPAPQLLGDYTVVASDGSFIAPDRHTPARFYLINIGKVVLGYGSAPRAALLAEPKMYVKDEELFISSEVRRVPVSGVVLGLKRAVVELAAVAEIAFEQARPALALQDGTLILWALEGQPDFVVEWVLESYLETLRTLRDAGIPVAAYISSPASSDVVNGIRVSVCDYPTHGRRVDCDDCRGRIAAGHVPACEIVPDIGDRALFARAAQLRAGERSPLYASGSKILERYDPDCRVLFFYLHTGSEIARVEVPRWVAEDAEQLDFTHAAIVEQCRLGRGYPSALQEAHELAAIRPDERRVIDVLIEEALARRGLAFPRSGKDASKRGRFA